MIKITGKKTSQVKNENVSYDMNVPHKAAADY